MYVRQLLEHRKLTCTLRKHPALVETRRDQLLNESVSMLQSVEVQL